MPRSYYEKWYDVYIENRDFIDQILKLESKELQDIFDMRMRKFMQLQDIADIYGKVKGTISDRIDSFFIRSIRKYGQHIRRHTKEM